MIFDSHAHYNDSRFAEEAENGAKGILAEVLQHTVKYILNAGTNVTTSLESIALAETYPQVYASVGIHPHEVEGLNEAETFSQLHEMLLHEKVRAIGEIGLDFHYDFSPRALQRHWLELQMQFAQNTGYPVILHDREAHGQCMEVIRNFPKVTGILHSFSGSVEMAQELVKRGYYISFSGVITFKNASKILEVVERVPLESLLIETDCPYLAPHPHRGKINHSGYLPYTIEAVAQRKGLDYDSVCEQTCRNACRVFGIQI